MKTKINKDEIISVLGIFFITLGGYFHYSYLSEKLRVCLYSILVGAGVFLLLIEILKSLLNKQYTKKQLLTIAGISLVGLLVWHRMITFYVTLTIAVAFINKDLKKLILYLFASSLISFALILFLNAIDVIPDCIQIRPNNNGGFNRYGMGFNHPNVLYRFYVATVMLGAIYFKGNELYFLATTILGLIFYKITDSRTGIIILSLLTVLWLLPKTFKRKISQTHLVPCMFIGVIAFTLIIAFFFNDIASINKLFSGRPGLWKIYAKEINFLGHFKGIEKHALDNLFLNMFYKSGFIGMIFYILLIYFAFKDKKNKGNYNVFIVVIISFIYGMTENFSSINECWFLLFVLLQNLNDNKIKEIDDTVEIKSYDKNVSDKKI